MYLFYSDSHSVRASVETGNSIFFFPSNPETKLWVEMPTQTTLSENVNVSQATYIPGNFENIFCPSPTQGKILAGKAKVEARQYCLK